MLLDDEDIEKNNPLDGQMCYDEMEIHNNDEKKDNKIAIDGQMEFELVTKEVENIEDEMPSKILNDKKNDRNAKGVVYKTLDEVLHSSMIPYTEHVVLDRALPRVEDGLKPVQRRILFSMLELGLYPDKQYRKSARIVGDCMGKYHPHGDSSVYDAMVRMSQDFSLRAPLVDGHGNFGSMDGDSAAAMRYTEAKMTPLALEMLRDLEKDTVKWSYNFDDTLKEPDMMPGRFPNLLVNGASGIAVGVATNIPPHNLGEVIDGVVAFIDNPKIKLSEMMKIIKAPDFPTGGNLIVGPELEQAYATGKGKVIIRAKVNIEKNGDKESLIITELPYQTNKAALLQKIAELKELNKDKLQAISEIRDESDRNGLRAVIKLKKEGNAKAILAYLFKASGLEVSFGINMVAIAGGKPRQLGLIEIISYYSEYQKDIIVRRTKYDLFAAKERAHIVEGLLIAIKNIDEVIRIIKKSANIAEAKLKLRERFILSEKQATAILEMRLSRLVNLERTKLEEELKELNALIIELEKILASKALQFDIVKKEMLEIKRKFKNDRRSTILKTADIKLEEVDENKVFEKNVIIAVSAGKHLKQIPSKNFSMAQKEISENTSIFDIHTLLCPCKSTDQLLIVTNRGNAIKINAGDIPEAKWKDKGTPLFKIEKGADINEFAVSIIKIVEGDESVLIFTKNGMVKKSKLSELIISKNYYQVVKLSEDEVVSCEIDKPNKSILMLTKEGISLNFDKSDIPTQGRISGGVKGMNLDDKDKVIFASQLIGSKITLGTEEGYLKNVDIKHFSLSPRYRKGVKCINLMEKDHLLFAHESIKVLAVDMGLKILKITEKQILEGDRLFKGEQVIKKRILGIYPYQTEC